MGRHILDRYSRTGDGRLIIDIAAVRVEDLYNYYDRSAPYLKKDLEPELVEYIVESVRELGPEPLALQFTFDEPVDADQMSRLRDSVNRYFLYLRELVQRELKDMFRTSLILFLLGLSILTLSVWMNRLVDHQETVLGEVVAEGVMVAAWVSLWNALATFLINWVPKHREIRIYERIAMAPVLFDAGVREGQKTA